MLAKWASAPPRCGFSVLRGLAINLLGTFEAAKMMPTREESDLLHGPPTRLALRRAAKPIPRFDAVLAHWIDAVACAAHEAVPDVSPGTADRLDRGDSLAAVTTHLGGLLGLVPLRPPGAFLITWRLKSEVGEISPDLF